MKLLSYLRPDGTTGHGRLTDDGTAVVELGDGDLGVVIAAGEIPEPGTGGHVLPLDEVAVKTPVGRPGKVLCAATNYQEHIVEGGGTPVDRDRTSPKLFTKPDTSLAGPGEVWEVPRISSTGDYEVELAVVLGSGGRDIGVDDALRHVFGYCTANDLSLRSLDGMGFERDTDNPAVGFFDWLEGKWSDGSAPVGPWLVTADEVPDPQSLGLRLEVNGEVRQESTTAAMIFTCAELIAFASRLCTLRAGDMILTGTPSGVGATTSTFLRDGDLVVAEVEGLGRLETPVRAVTEV